jgi:hypothetical protein
MELNSFSLGPTSRVNEYGSELLDPIESGEFLDP